MIKKNKGGKIILVTGLLAIAIVTICAFEKDNITRKYYEYTIDKKYSSTDVNDSLSISTTTNVPVDNLEQRD